MYRIGYLKILISRILELPAVEVAYWFHAIDYIAIVGLLFLKIVRIEKINVNFRQ